MESSFIICVIAASKCTNRNLKSTVLNTGKYLIMEVCFEDLKV